MSSVLSYNQFNFGPIFKHGEKAKEERRGEKHQPSFVKQLMYFILFIVLNLGYVIILLLLTLYYTIFQMQADNLHGDHHDVHGQRQVGGH